ncbi:hypothetical protein NDU88_010102 [Pleurodeles waltl]|uniref:Uncharacterized protein n=1 Tax=Pleurodeles waltl TaxID=8319 RepID=A0AAV7RYJ6_PLEWA|nr:hypothetical protein NDU88_010102 [Pleurodeles waltl]
MWGGSTGLCRYALPSTRRAACPAWVFPTLISALCGRPDPPGARPKAASLQRVPGPAGGLKPPPGARSSTPAPGFQFPDPPSLCRSPGRRRPRSRLGPPYHSSPRLQPWGRAASPGAPGSLIWAQTGPSDPLTGPRRPPPQCRHLLPLRLARYGWIILGPSGARGLCVLHLRLLGHAPPNLFSSSAVFFLQHSHPL